MKSVLDDAVDVIGWRESSKPLRIKYGADPSRPDLHLGHYVVLQKLKILQEAGHEVVFVIGDFTACIGDPSGRNETRPPLTKDEVKSNSITYQEQVFQILNPDKTKIAYNSEWLARLTSEEVVRLSAQYTVARLLERDDFEKRYRSQTPIYLHEFLYPLMQGYDSVAIKADVEVGGTDQKFNLLVGRELQKAYGQEPQAVLTYPLLEGTDGQQKMSKSYGNSIGLNEAPRDMFGKVMGISDELMYGYYKKLFNQADGELRALGLGPRDLKVRLAHSVVTIFHGSKIANQAVEEFERIFKKGGAPNEVPVISLSSASVDLIKLMKEQKIVSSTSEARRLLQGQALSLNGRKISQANVELDFSKNSSFVLRVGKKRFYRLICEKE